MVTIAFHVLFAHPSSAGIDFATAVNYTAHIHYSHFLYIYLVLAIIVLAPLLLESLYFDMASSTPVLPPQHHVEGTEYPYQATFCCRSPLASCVDTLIAVINTSNLSPAALYIIRSVMDTQFNFTLIEAFGCGKFASAYVYVQSL